MAEYTVQAPDGKTLTLQGPDGASQADIIAQAQALYQPKSPDAALKNATPGRYAPSSAPKPAPKPAPKRNAPNAFLDKYNNIRNSLITRTSDPAQQKIALNRFDSDPRAQKLRAMAGLAPLSTRKQEVRQAARQAQKSDGFFDALTAGAERSFFGLPERVTAALHYYLPESKLETVERGGRPVPRGKTYQDQLALERAEVNRRREASTAGDITGQVLGSVTAGTAAGKLAVRGVSAIAPRVGNVLEGLAALRKGQKVRNAAKIAAIGGLGGGAQSAGEGSNVVEGAAFGAVAAPLLVGGLKLGQVASRPFRDVLRITGAGKILSRLTSASQDQLERLAASYRQATGAEPTLFELLPLADRNRILKNVVVGKDNVVEAASNAIRGRARNLGPEMSARARQILQPQRDFIQQGIHRDLTAARGGQLAHGDAELIESAMDNPTDMLRLRDEEARAIMAPHDNTPVVPNLEDLFPSVPGPQGTRFSVDPEVSTVIRSAAGTLRQRAPDAGVTAGDITDMISTLRGDLGRGGIEGRNADRAIQHLQDMLDQHAPDAGAAARQMSDAYAARSRMAEGMKEGSTTRLREEVQVGTSRREARKVRNAYDTAEGAGGRSLGQGNRVLSDLGGSPEEALRATVKQSRGSTGRQLAQNVGPAEADLLGTAARAQDESAQALASASNKAQSGSGDGADAEMLVQAIAGLHPSSFITTKANAFRKLFDMTYIPESRARTIVDMVFSQDPAMMQRALNAIGNEPNGAQVVKALSLIVGGAAGKTDIGDLGLPEGDDAPAPSVEDDLKDMPVDEEVSADEEPETDVSDVGGDSPYAPALQQIYQNESPELIDLIQRVKHQESRGDQSAVSPKGAVGIMQVMPGTAPEAAQLAGLPWDEDAYHNDATYNELLGIAYLSEQLTKYDGDVERALAAYNAGPQAVDNALQMHEASWLQNLPAETQDYVARIG